MKYYVPEHIIRARTEAGLTTGSTFVSYPRGFGKTRLIESLREMTEIHYEPPKIIEELYTFLSAEEACEFLFGKGYRRIPLWLEDNMKEIKESRKRNEC